MLVRPPELQGGSGSFNQRIAGAFGRPGEGYGAGSAGTGPVGGGTPSVGSGHMQRSLLERRGHLEARVEALGPGRVAELERTRARFAAVEEELAGAESAPQWWRDYQVWN